MHGINEKPLMVANIDWKRDFGVLLKRKAPTLARDGTGASRVNGSISPPLNASQPTNFQSPTSNNAVLEATNFPGINAHFCQLLRTQNNYKCLVGGAVIPQARTSRLV
ncbi:hypothetical protein VCV18_005527 [Metarhizium anisopliae]